MRMISVVCGVVVAAAVCGGCLQKEVGQTIYLSPSGAVWTVIERDVRSDEKDPASRIREEQDYLACERCGELLAADAAALAPVRALVREAFGYEARFGHFPIVGLCPACARG